MINEYKEACKFTFAYQAFLGVLTSMILDGGQIFSFWLIAIVAYLVPAIMIIYRNSKSVNKVDLFYLKFGSLIILILAPIIINIVWIYKGVI